MEFLRELAKTFAQLAKDVWLLLRHVVAAIGRLVGRLFGRRKGNEPGVSIDATKLVATFMISTVVVLTLALVPSNNVLAFAVGAIYGLALPRMVLTRQ